eukprot:GHUV01019417.1.p1 GENE.GHUV01019417.1~~GHUV01019417.1.p1  ORF type:complete len:225 (+),score=67.80 GHUV01019417.1:161-835(+)
MIQKRLQSARLPFSSRQARCSRLVMRVSTAGPLSSEAAALSKYRSSNDEGLEPCLRLLKQAAADKSVQPELVEGALAYLEQNHLAAAEGRYTLLLRAVLSCPAAQPAADIDGSWRLMFSTATSSRLMQYIPVQEDFLIQMGPKQCALESVVGPFRFNIRGQIAGWNAASGAMDFQFTAVDILLFNKQIWQVTPKTKPKTYTFYYEGGGIAAARSSAGGLSLLRK